VRYIFHAVKKKKKRPDLDPMLFTRSNESRVFIPVAENIGLGISIQEKVNKSV
jgi:hypothetical protein